MTQFPNLKVVAPWKHGRLLQCINCESRWFFREHGQLVDRIHDELWASAEHWSRTSLDLSEPLRRALAAIGGVANYDRDEIQVPCRVRHASGEWQDLAVVVVSKSPPCRWYKPETIRWANDIVEISDSQAALPHDVRQASASAEELRMAFAPTGVIDGRGIEYTLDSTSTFFDHFGVLGKDIRLSGRKRWWWKRLVSPTPAQAFYFVDWFAGCEETLRAGNGDFSGE